MRPTLIATLIEQRVKRRIRPSAEALEGLIRENQPKQKAMECFFHGQFSEFKEQHRPRSVSHKIVGLASLARQGLTRKLFDVLARQGQARLEIRLISS